MELTEIYFTNKNNMSKLFTLRQFQFRVHSIYVCYRFLWCRGLNKNDKNLSLVLKMSCLNKHESHSLTDHKDQVINGLFLHN